MFANLLNLISLFLAAKLFTVEEFAKYLVILSLGWVLSAVVSLNLNDSFSFFIGRDKLSQTKISNLVLRIAVQYLANAIILLLVYRITMLFTDEILTFLDPKVLLLAIVLSLSRLILDLVYRGLVASDLDKRSDLYYVFSMGGVPLLSVLLCFQYGAGFVIFVISVFTFCTAFWALSHELKTFKSQKLILTKIPKKYFTYGVPRIPALFGYAFLLGSPVLLVQMSTSDAEVVARVGLTMSMLRMLSIFGTPLSYLLIPRFKSIEGSLISGINGRTLYWAGLACLVLIGLSLIALQIGPLTVALVLDGSTSGSNIIASDILFLGTGAALAIVVFRPVMDGYSSFSYSGIILGFTTVLSILAQMINISAKTNLVTTISLVSLLIPATIYIFLFFSKFANIKQ
ncbi:MAG: hypothetical protein L7R84_05465 [Balneolaceae bacterium]|nr:hypothetical protein [Balneolaceae bacterium]